MKVELFFPALMLAESLGACVVCAVKGDFNAAAYWLLAAGLTTVVSFKPF
jgi:hypothetical protein